MKTVQDLHNNKVPTVRIDPAMNRLRSKTLFPQKLAKANQMLKTAKLPGKASRG